eukprot:TRINITY_DN1532_c0_g4_i1.p2 TRINITY_DN1532_c0_g4~~TRINITY_DN1532_c0_g4_i1.p2  ORF type:complete len:101 (-),score=24.50 TRINITY_DN1532_c0_g4_i1:318-620(-)
MLFKNSISPFISILQPPPMPLAEGAEVGLNSGWVFEIKVEVGVVSVGVGCVGVGMESAEFDFFKFVGWGEIFHSDSILKSFPTPLSGTMEEWMMMMCWEM